MILFKSGLFEMGRQKKPGVTVGAQTQIVKLRKDMILFRRVNECDAAHQVQTLR
jgi:hypothetical protein